ncbi:acyl carrier protein [Streptomyces netropsis]|uniref:acyl carrier protein n=1 Tax=Streptomyces netropsis TaxID=55404 RepID=UPI0037A215B8
MEPAYDLMARLLTEHFGIPEEEITPDATFEQLEVDSLARVELITMIEDRLHVALPEEHGDATVGEAAAYLDRLVADRADREPAAPAGDQPVAMAGPAR